jgi:hypothetical protein
MCVNKSQFVRVIFEPPCTLRAITEINRDKLINLVFLDLKSAFDTIPKELL